MLAKRLGPAAAAVAWLAVGVATAIPTSDLHAMPGAGTLVRVTARKPEREYWIGSFVSLDRDPVTLRDAERHGATVSVPALQVLRVEMREMIRC